MTQSIQHRLGIFIPSLWGQGEGRCKVAGCRESPGGELLLFLGIFGFTPDKSEASSDKIKRVRIDLYCERITI